MGGCDGGGYLGIPGVRCAHRDQQTAATPSILEHRSSISRYLHIAERIPRDCFFAIRRFHHFTSTTLPSPSASSMSSAPSPDSTCPVDRLWKAVADFIRRLERTFRIAYGRDAMSSETRDTLLYCQLQEGLRYELMKGPAVSGATKYQELCVAAKNEEKRLAELQRRQQYSKSIQSLTPRPRQPQTDHVPKTPADISRRQVHKPDGVETKKCFFCKKPGHLMRDCRKRRDGNSGFNRPAATKQVTVENMSEVGQPNPYDLLFSSESEDEQDVKQIRVMDHGSQSKLARVIVQGVPADGLIDTGADITIMGRELFARVAAVAKLRKKNFRKPDKVPRTYDRKTFHLDGCMDMDISFDGKTMSTVVYVKMDAYDQLLLSEGVCRQLGIVSYHSSVDSGKSTKKSTEGKSSEEVAVVPTIRVNLVKSLRLPANQGAVVSVELTGCCHQNAPSLLVQNQEHIERETGLRVEDAIVTVPESGVAQIVVRNCSGFTQSVAGGECLAMAEVAEILTVPILADNYARYPCPGGCNRQQGSGHQLVRATNCLEHPTAAKEETVRGRTQLRPGTCSEHCSEHYYTFVVLCNGV